ncbi:MAG: hypothetical protein NZ740_02030 [Kiritimatiellae bacterium]|nr:hypothetical protein [Kiritimatiellia bacterium]MDW8457869.1 hypothetical protein [Verrucomicrobiota bacterium]
MDKSGNLQFNRDGITYLIMGDEENLNAVSIVMPNIASISDEDDRIRVLRAADVANARTWGTRIFTFADSVHVCSDLFVDSPDELAAYLEKVIMCLRFSSDQFFSALNELNSTDIQGVYGVTSDQSEAEEFELPTEMVTPGENPLQEESEDLTELMGVPQPGAHPENLMQMLRSMGMIRDMHCPVCGTDYEWIVGIIKPGRRPGECPNCRWAPQ